MGELRGMIRVVFVCLGNICRSPIAEGVMRALVLRSGVEGQFLIDSAGTGNWHVGSPPDNRAQQVLLDKGIDISGLRGRQFGVPDFDAFDHIIAMDQSNYRDIQALYPSGGSDKVRLLLSYAPELGLKDVPDPYYGGYDGFETVLDMVEVACERLLEDLV